MASDSDIKSSIRSGASSPNSPSQGGVRLDAKFEALGLDTSPLAKMIATYDHPRPRRHYSSGFPEHSHAASVSSSAADFQKGGFSCDGDPFFSTDAETSSAPGLDLSTHTTNHDEFLPQSPLDSSRTLASERPRPKQLDEVDAQNFYPATACVFVANLPEAVDDETLEYAVTKVFRNFGTVFVKIRRDQRNMPFAFCQYTEDEHAKLAMKTGKGEVIEGRPCRTEMVKANRSFVMYKVHDSNITPDEALDQLKGFGPISKCDMLHEQIAEALKLESGILIEFKTFDPTRDVIAAFRRNPDYRIIPYDLKKSLKNNPQAESNKAYLERYDIDRRSIFVGDLPSRVTNTKELLEEMMGEVGDVVATQVIRKEPRNGYAAPVVFAFVEFARPDMTELAIHRLNGALLAGSKIRIERKESHNIRSSRARTSLATKPSFDKSPAHIRGRGVSNANTGPSTPMRSSRGQDTAQHGNITFPPDDTLQYSFMPYSNQNIASPVYGQSPYHDPNSVNYPVTPQATPGVFNSPYYYHPAPYNWMTPYLQDPQLTNPAAVALDSPMQSSHFNMNTNLGDQDPSTPTRAASKNRNERHASVQDSHEAA